MTLGIDLSSLQSPHRFRGIGSVLINFINHLPQDFKSNNHIVFFIYDKDYSTIDALELLNIKNIDFEIKYFSPPKTIDVHLPGKLNLIINTVNRIKKISHLRFGDTRINRIDLKNLDFYLQIDPGQPLPSKRQGFKNVLFLHDIIPYILEWDYLWNYNTARTHNFSRKAALRVQMRRFLYKYEYKAVIKNTNILLANSEHTKNDFIKYFNINTSKIIVTHLGVDPPHKETVATIPTQAYRTTSWGNLQMNYNFNTNIPYILFVGGADRRRKIEDLVTAFNRIRAQNIMLKLVLVGDSMQGPMNIGTEEIQYALKTSSYKEDIVYLGYETPENLRWLYEHALSFIFPSRYEGFGLPVLEALSYGTPVIAYDNGATKEVGGDIVTYVNNYLELENTIKYIINNKNHHNNDLITERKTQALRFTWDQTVQNIIKSLNK